MPKVSVFRSVAEVRNPIYFDLIDYLERTRDGEWEDVVTKCRLIRDKKERDDFKRSMPTTTLSGEFDYRSDSRLITHSGYIAMDLDNVDNLDVEYGKLIRDKFVFSVFMSTSGTGLRVLFKIEPDKHKEAFIGVSQYLWDKYNLQVDVNSSVSKPYVVSYDPNIYINYGDVPTFKKYVKETVIKQVEFFYTPGDFEEILNQITGRRINLCEDYNDWVRCGFSIASHFGENGRQFFHKISEISEKYKVSRCNKQYDYCLRNKSANPVNISTFYFLCKQAGVNIYSEQTKSIIRTTRNGKKAGLSKAQIVNNLSKFQGINNTEKIVDTVFESQVNEEEDEDSVINLLEMFISHSYSLKMNEVTGYIEDGGEALTPSDLNTIFISAKKIVPKLDYQLMIRLLKSDFVPKFNPLFEFFGSDGIPIILPPMPDEPKPVHSPLIFQLAKTIINDDPAFTLHFVRKWLVGIVSAAHKVHSPLLLALLGPQNTGKTEWFRRLFPKELQHYYAESKLDKEKDDELLMTENLLIVDDELGGKSKQDNNKLKNITSKQWFSLRRPYGDHNEKILRLAVLGGTSNTLEIMSDPTGNRRIIPILVNDIDKHLYNSIDKKELMLEAFRLYKEGFDWRIMSDDIRYLNKDRENFEMIVKEGELLSKYFMSGDGIWLSTTEIIVEIENLTHQKLSTSAMGRELDKQGFVKKSMRINSFQVTKKWAVIRQNRPQLQRPNQDEQPEDLPF